MKITFILPMYLRVPSGGFKVVYEYANRLTLLGHQVTIIHPRNVMPDNRLISRLRARFWKYKIILQNHPLLSWINMVPSVKLVLTESLQENNIPDGDVVIATACETAFPVSEYSVSKGRKIYLLQSYENWKNKDSDVQVSLKLPLFKITVSRNLYETVLKIAEPDHVAHLPIGIDLSSFKVITPINKRLVPRVAMLAHPGQEKGMIDGLQALDMVRQHIPNLQVILFGTQPRFDVIPDWVEYIRLPSQSKIIEIYNSCQVFVSPSWIEGWGLPASEAMACGCALVSADNGGIHDFANDGFNAYIVPAKQPELLALKIHKLLSDNETRHKMVSAGVESIRQFSWKRAVSSMEKLLYQMTAE